MADYTPNSALPSFVQELLANWPASGTGSRAVHRHLLTLANRLRHYVPAEQAAELIRAHLPRPAKGREIEQTIQRAYNLKAIPKTDRPPDHLPDLARIEQIVADRANSKSVAELLEQRSPLPFPKAYGRGSVPPRGW